MFFLLVMTGVSFGAGMFFGAYLVVRAYHRDGIGAFYKGGIVPNTGEKADLEDTSEIVVSREVYAPLEDGLTYDDLGEALKVQNVVAEGVYTGPGGHGGTA